MWDQVIAKILEKTVIAWGEAKKLVRDKVVGEVWNASNLIWLYYSEYVWGIDLIDIYHKVLIAPVT